MVRENDSRDVHTLGMVGGKPATTKPPPIAAYRFGRYFRTVATAWITPATAPKSAMICLIVSLRGLSMGTLPEAQTPRAADLILQKLNAIPLNLRQPRLGELCRPGRHAMGLVAGVMSYLMMT